MAGVAISSERYNEDIVRAFVIATIFWGLAAFAVGVFIAFQLTYPVLNLGLDWTTFGRLRPLHTSARDLRLRRQCASRHLFPCRAAHLPDAALAADAPRRGSSSGAISSSS